jgi:hypothetical protein
MPLPLRTHLAAARRDPLFATLTGHPAFSAFVLDNLHVQG